MIYLLKAIDDDCKTISFEVCDTSKNTIVVVMENINIDVQEWLCVQVELSELRKVVNHLQKELDKLS